MATYLIFVLSATSLGLGPDHEGGGQAQQDPVEGGLHPRGHDLEAVLELEHFMSVAPQLFPQAFPQLEDGHVWVKHQVEGESSAEGADADSEVRRHVGGTLGKVLRDVGVFPFFDKEGKTAAVAGGRSVRAQLLSGHPLHSHVQPVDLLGCGLDHPQHREPHGVVGVEIVQHQGTVGELPAQERRRLQRGLFSKRSSNVFQQGVKAVKEILQGAAHSSKDSLILIEAYSEELLAKSLLDFLKLQTWR